MTVRTNARLAGAAFLIYIAAGITSLILAGHTAATEILGILASFSALVLGVTLYGLTRREDRDLALLALACRVLEAGPGHGEIYFAVGSTIFAWLLLRGRLIPSALAWIGVTASALLVLLLPLQTAGFFGGPRAWSSSITWAVWLPMLVFELALAGWLIVKGVATPADRRRDAAVSRA